MTNKLKAQDILKSKEEVPTISAVELAELQKAANKVADLEKALDDAKTKADAEKVELEKSIETIKAEKADLEKARKEKQTEEMVELVKGFTFINEDDQEATVAFLMKAKDSIKGASVILSQLNKAQEAIDNFATQEHGNDEHVDIEKAQADDEWDALASDVFKSRKSK